MTFGVASDGTLYVSSLQLANSALYEVDPTSGVANFVAALPDFPIDVEIEPDDVPIVAMGPGVAGQCKANDHFRSVGKQKRDISHATLCSA